MYRLVIVAGPNRGSSFALIDGENSIGRQIDNHIVLTSVKVSKRHCSLLVRPDEVFLRDDQSTNGTFVNGSMVKKIKMNPGDKLSVGDFVMELTQTGAPARRGVHLASSLSPGMPAITGNLAHSMPQSMGAPQSQPMATLSLAPQMDAPQDPAGHLKFIFEGKIMPIFYGMLMKNEYKGIVAVLFLVLITIAVFGAAMPIQEIAEKSIRSEALLRAKVLAREVADRAAPAIAQHMESQIDLSVLENEESVKVIAITNTNNQIIAPQSRLNQILAGGVEARFAMNSGNLYKVGEEPPVRYRFDDNVNSVVYVEPIRTVDPRLARSQVTAMVVVGIDFSRNMLEAGGLGVAYGTGFVIAGLAALLIYLIVTRLSLKPYEVLNDDLDQVLRGELPRVTHEFKIEETDALWNNINAAAQRIPKGGGSDFNEEKSVNWDQEFSSVRALSDASNFGFIGFDSNGIVVGMNTMFEEISSIRIDQIGQGIQQIARDQSFIKLYNSLKEVVEGSASRSGLDETEFTGVAYTIVATAAGPAGQAGMALVFKKKD